MMRDHQTDSELGVACSCTNNDCALYDRSGNNAPHHDRATGLCPDCFVRKAFVEVAKATSMLPEDSVAWAILDEVASLLDEPEAAQAFADMWARKWAAAKRAALAMAEGRVQP